VASISRDVVVEITPPRDDRQCAVNLDRNLKRKLTIIMRQLCTSVTDRQTDGQTDTDIVA